VAVEIHFPQKQDHRLCRWPLTIYKLIADPIQATIFFIPAVKDGIMNNGITYGIVDFTSRGIDLVDDPLLGGELIFVLIIDVGAVNTDVPVAPFFRSQRMERWIPFVEDSNNRNHAGVRGPDAKSDTTLIKNRTQTLKNWPSAHGRRVTSEIEPSAA
jgi:hypothetical protein